MTHQDSDTLFPVEALPGDLIAADGKRSVKSPWTMVRIDALEVTQEDIDGAMRENSHSCMIAEAIKRQIKGAKAVSVDIATIRWTDTVKNRRIVCLTPLVAQNGLSMFDLGVKPKPFKFPLRSAQITTVSSRPKLGPDGKPVLRPERVVNQKQRARQFVLKNEVAREHVSPPKPRVEISGNGEVPVKLGGLVPPHNRASRFRKFGAKGFTWLDDENPEDVIKRQRLAYGVIEPAEPFSNDTPPSE